MFASDKVERRAARLYVTAALGAGAVVEPTASQAHHLRTVLRLARGAAVAAFNEADGEWLCRLGEAGRTGLRLLVERRLRPPAGEPDLWLLFAPIKRVRLDWLVEKATELGVAELRPVWTERTQMQRLNEARLHAQAVAAAEQSERLSVPRLAAPERLDRLIAAWPDGRPLLLCDESGGGEPIASAALHLPAAVLVGPEGGFAETELDALSKLPFVTAVGLGPRVLRAETAALAALAVLQAIAGDWRRPRSR